MAVFPTRRDRLRTENVMWVLRRWWKEFERCRIIERKNREAQDVKTRGIRKRQREMGEEAHRDREDDVKVDSREAKEPDSTAEPPKKRRKPQRRKKKEKGGAEERKQPTPSQSSDKG
jgi:hypothetical protein